jgi:hypothetical protein
MFLHWLFGPHGDGSQGLTTGGGSTGVGAGAGMICLEHFNRTRM